MRGKDPVPNCFAVKPPYEIKQSLVKKVKNCKTVITLHLGQYFLVYSPEQKLGRAKGPNHRSTFSVHSSTVKADPQNSKTLR